MQEATHILHSIPVDPSTGAISVPIYQTSTFVQSAPGVNQGFDYSRSNNPTRKALEDLVAKLEGGHSGYAFASGLAAVDAILKTLKAGDEIVAVDDIYGGTFRIFTHVYEKFGITIKYVDPTDSFQVEEALSAKTAYLWLETPTNPTLKICDIKVLSQLAHRVGARVVVDNTFASPLLQKPLALGADLVLHSATKYLAGHSDVIAGIVVAKTQELGEVIKFHQNASGGVLGPWDSWLTIRGIETLELRVNRQCENALQVARFLGSRPEVDRVYYPGLASHPTHAVAKTQQTAFGGVVSFSLKTDTSEQAIQFVTSTDLFKLAESLGGVKSLLCHPATMTHKGTPAEIRHGAGIQDSLIRLSCGIEAAEDLIKDLGQAFEGLNSSKPEPETREIVTV